MVESQAINFGETARAVSNRARSLGLKAPVFRSPPRIVGVSRTMRLREDGKAVVSVAYRGRPWPAVVADLIEGVLVVNELTGVAASRHRDDMWLPFAEQSSVAA